MPSNQKVLVASSLHPWDDPRIFYKQCHSLNKFYKITLIAVAEKKSFQINNIQVIGLPKPRSIINRLKNGLKIIKELFYGKYAILHFHDPELLWVGFTAKLLGRKVIFDIHENILGIVQIRNWIPRIIKKSLGNFMLFIENISQEIFDGIILSEKSYLKYFKNNINTITIQNFVKIEPDKTVKNKLQDHTIIYVGAVTYSRGIYDLVEAVIELQKKDPSVKLIIIGRMQDQDFEKKLNQKIKSALFPENIQLLGHINFLIMKKFISIASVGIIPLHPNDNYLYSYPTKIFDYMNWGLPYVYSNLPYWKKTFGDKCGGISFEACNKIDLIEKIERILYNNKLWHELALDCRKNVHRFNWKTEEKKLLYLYKNILVKD